MKIIGLSGTNGAGKDSVAEILRDEHNYMFVPVSNLLRDEARRRGMPIERETLRTISAEWRRESGLGVLIDKAIELYRANGGDKKFSGLVVSSIRNPGEVDTVHNLGGRVVWVDADPKIRYERIFSRQRTREDNKTFNQFIQEEKAEMQHSGDEATLSVRKVMKKADTVLLNEGATIVELSGIVKNKLQGIL